LPMKRHCAACRQAVTCCCEESIRWGGGDRGRNTSANPTTNEA
jgi:hypothetical protein